MQRNLLIDTGDVGFQELQTPKILWIWKVESPSESDGRVTWATDNETRSWKVSTDMPAEIQVSLDTVWVVACAALVFFMQLGFAMLESGMVRSKNAVNVIMKNYTDMCFGGLAFWAVGYGLMFGASEGWFGTDKFLMSGVADWDYTMLLFQVMFAATAATIVSGALAERIRFAPYIVAATIISCFVYPIFGGWVWNDNGWLAQMGFIDFAGSTVVHSLGGWCALAGVIALGPRLGRFGQDGTPREISGHSLPLVAFGGMILWMGWFGFNGGSILKADASIGSICLNTHLSGCAGVVGLVLARVFTGQRVLLTHTVNGGLAGLVAVTAGCATMDPVFAVVTGLVAGLVCAFVTSLMDPFLLDDAVGAVAVHGAAGMWGTLAAGLFVAGDLFNLATIKVQLIGIGACFIWTFPLAFITFKTINFIVGLRVSSLDEQRGLDYTEHYELGYPEFQGTALNAGKA